MSHCPLRSLLLLAASTLALQGCARTLTENQADLATERDLGYEGQLRDGARDSGIKDTSTPDLLRDDAHLESASPDQAPLDTIVLDLGSPPADAILGPCSSSGWCQMSSPTTETLAAVWGTSATNVFAVGYRGTILHFDGGTWTTMDSTTTRDLRDVWGTSSDDVFTVGDAGTILRYGGSTWTAMTVAVSEDLRGVWGTGATHVMAVGSSGTMLRYDGSAWARITSPSTGYLRDIWGATNTNALAVGLDNAALRYNGATLTDALPPPPTNAQHYAVCGRTDDDFFVFGDGGLGRRFLSGTWSTLTLPTAFDLRECWAGTPDVIYAVGFDGTILHFDGQDWLLEGSGLTRNLYGVWGDGLSTVFAVGNSGTIFVRR